jgi:hypothetical protein
MKKNKVLFPLQKKKLNDSDGFSNLYILIWKFI